MNTKQSGEIWAVSVDCTAATSVSQMWRDTWFCKIFPWQGVWGVGGGNRVKPTRDLSVLFLPTACQSTKPAGQKFQSWSLNEGEESRFSIHGGDGHLPLCISQNEGNTDQWAGLHLCGRNAKVLSKYKDFFCFFYLMMLTLQHLALGFVYSVGTFKRHRGLPSGVPGFLNQSEQRQPFSEVFYYSESDPLHLPRYEVQSEIKIFYLPLQQIERL